MPRDRIKTTREDATGFEVGAKGRRKQPILKPIDQDALNTFAARRRVAKAAPEQPVTHSAAPLQDEQATFQDHGSANALAAKIPAVADPSDSQPDPETAPSASGLVDLVVPPRAKSAGTLHLTLRLRVLNRHVAALSTLAEQGIEPAVVLRTAYRRLPDIRFEPRYVPRVAEPSGPVAWNHRVTVTVKKDTLQAIEAQVRNGASAARSHLLLGQIERAWFASLEDTMKELSE